MSRCNWLQRTLGKVFSNPSGQTLRIHGSHMGDFLIADLYDIERRNADKLRYDQIKQVCLQLKQSIDLDNLSGFGKNRGYSIPKPVSDASKSFIEDISSKKVQEDFQRVFERIRTSMDYKCRDLTAKSGHIITPDFEFSVTCVQDSANRGSVLFTRKLVNISPQIIDDDAFNKVFEEDFDELTFEFCKIVNIEDLIDRIEDLDSDKIELTYPPSPHCEIEIEGSSFNIKVTPGSLTIHTPTTKSPKLLLKTFFEAQRQLAGTPVVKAIAAGSR